MAQGQKKKTSGRFAVGRYVPQESETTDGKRRGLGAESKITTGGGDSQQGGKGAMARGERGVSETISWVQREGYSVTPEHETRKAGRVVYGTKRRRVTSGRVNYLTPQQIEENGVVNPKKE